MFQSCAFGLLTTFLLYTFLLWISYRIRRSQRQWINSIFQQRQVEHNIFSYDLNSPVPFILNRQTKWDYYLTKLGMTHDIILGNSQFDDQIHIASPTAFQTRVVLKDDSIRQLFLELFSDPYLIEIQVLSKQIHLVTQDDALSSLQVEKVKTIISHIESLQNVRLSANEIQSISQFHQVRIAFQDTRIDLKTISGVWIILFMGCFIKAVFDVMSVINVSLLLFDATIVVAVSGLFLAIIQKIYFSKFGFNAKMIGSYFLMTILLVYPIANIFLVEINKSKVVTAEKNLGQIVRVGRYRENIFRRPAQTVNEHTQREVWIMFSSKQEFKNDLQQIRFRAKMSDSQIEKSQPGVDLTVQKGKLGYYWISNMDGISRL